MADCSVLSVNAPNPLTLPETDLSCLPAKLSQKLWVNPTEFLVVTHAWVIADWAVRISQRLRPRLPKATRRGPKSVYTDSSLVVLALIQVAWQMTYEDLVDYFRAHPQAAQVAGFPAGRVISVGQYWERRRALGILPFWFLFVGMVWQVTRMGILQGTDMILDATTQKAWFHEDSGAGWSFPKPWKGSVWGYKLIFRSSGRGFLVKPAGHAETAKMERNNGCVERFRAAVAPIRRKPGAIPDRFYASAEAEVWRTCCANPVIELCKLVRPNA